MLILVSETLAGPLNDVGIVPQQERSSRGFIWPFVAYKMSLCVGSFTEKRKGNAEQGASPEIQMPED